MKKIITGFHSIEEILRAEKNRQEKKEKSTAMLEIVYFKVGPRVKKILELAKSLNINVQKKEKKTLDDCVLHLPKQLQDHRGIILIFDSAQEEVKMSFEEFIANISQKENAFIAILDSITDPHNIGSIVRSADQLGVDGIIVPENKSAGGFEIIAKTSAGASAWVPIVSVQNLVRTVEKLKDLGFWIYGADAGGKSVKFIDFPKKIALVMGSEGSGIGRLLRDNCDEIISIPTCGKLDSLNVSVATGILFYEISNNRGKI